MRQALTLLSITLEPRAKTRTHHFQRRGAALPLAKSPFSNGTLNQNMDRVELADRFTNSPNNCQFLHKLAEGIPKRGRSLQDAIHGKC